MAKHKKKLPKVIYKSVWSEKMTENEKNTAQQKIDEIFDFIFSKALECQEVEPKNQKG